MDRPNIKDSLFEITPDCAINSRVLRAIFAYTKQKYDPKTDTFSGTFSKWGICVRDQHDDELAAHYFLQIGEGDFQSCPSRSFHARYCDYHSELAKNPMNTAIKENPGTYTIDVWLPQRDISSASYFARAIAKAYDEAMIAELPDYAILTSELLEGK